MPKERKKENKGLPERCRWKNGAIRYRVPHGCEHLWDNKQEFTLGKTASEAYRTLSDRMSAYEIKSPSKQMKHAIDRYALEVVPEKALSTQRSNLYSLERLRKAFGELDIKSITPVMIYQYQDAVASNLSKKHYNLDHEVLSHIFTLCIRWGLREDHPMTGRKVLKFKRQKRDRYVEDWELREFLSVAPDYLVAYCNLKLLLGQDKGDLLSILISDIKPDSLIISARKKTSERRQTNRQRQFPYKDKHGQSNGLKEALEAILALRNHNGSEFLFSTRNGEPYIKADGTTSGFDSIWQRAMKKALTETKLVISFTEHDLRAKVGSDAESDEEAQRQLDHASIITTRSTYRRKPVIMPVAKRGE